MVSSMILLPGLNVPVPLSLLHWTPFYNYGLCEENSSSQTPLWTSPLGTHYIRGTPGEQTWCDTDKICFPDLCTTESVVSSCRNTHKTITKSLTFCLTQPASHHPIDHPQGGTKNHILDIHPHPSPPCQLKWLALALWVSPVTNIKF